MKNNKLTPKQEAFANKYVELGNASEAYRQAYDAKDCTPKSVTELASQELGKVNVTSRVDEIRSQLAERRMVTLESICNELDEARVMAAKIEQPATMVTASMGKAKLHGLVTDKKEHSGSAAINVNMVSYKDE